MPIYEYKCQKCNKTHIQFAKIADRYKSPVCCGINTTLQIKPVPGKCENIDYICPHTGQRVQSKAQREEIFKKHNLQPQEIEI